LSEKLVRALVSAAGMRSSAAALYLLEADQPDGEAVGDGGDAVSQNGGSSGVTDQSPRGGTLAR
jgi:hypothetical protein